MTPSDWNWFLTITGTAASIVGLVFSLLAWVQADKAKKAAREATDAVRARNLSHNFSRWSVDARELLRAVRDQHFENAQRAATDLFGALAHNRGWQVGLKRESVLVELEDVIRLLGIVNTYLTEKEVFVGKLAKLADHCQTIYRKINEVTGNLDAQVDKL